MERNGEVISAKMNKCTIMAFVKLILILFGIQRSDTGSRWRSSDKKTLENARNFLCIHVDVVMVSRIIFIVIIE